MFSVYTSYRHFKRSLFPPEPQGQLQWASLPLFSFCHALEWEGSKSICSSQQINISFLSWLDYSSYSFLNSLVSGECVACERNYRVTTCLQKAHQEILGFSSHVSYVTKILHLRTEQFLSHHIYSECNLMVIVA